jgi:hypothetical protein
MRRADCARPLIADVRRRMTSRHDESIGSRLLEILIGVVILYVANRLLNPLPLAALLAWSIALILVWLRSSHRLAAAFLGLLCGVLLGTGIHAYIHLSGRSPEPPEGPFLHVLLDAAVGFIVGGLALAAGRARHLLQGRRAV